MDLLAAMPKDASVKQNSSETVSKAPADPIVEKQESTPVENKTPQNLPVETYSDVVTKANKAYLNGDLDEAMKLYTTALVLKPKDTWRGSHLTIPLCFSSTTKSGCSLESETFP